MTPRRWTTEVARHARRAGVDVSTDTLEEIASHLEDLDQAARDRGLDAAAARREALQALETSGLRPLGCAPRPNARAQYAGIANDVAAASRSRRLSMFYTLRMAWRQLRMNPVLALVTLLVIGLGSGAATVVYTIVDAVIVRPLPYAEPDRLVKLWDTNVEKGLNRDPISPVTFLDYKALPVFSDAAAWWRPDVNLVDAGLEPARVKTIETSANLLSVLGVRPQLGPGFPVDDALHSTDLVALISDRLWRARYGADDSIVGRHISLNALPYRVVGVMPPGFGFPDDVDVWQRLSWDPAQHDRQAHFMEAVARLAPGVTLPQARSAADTLAAQLGEKFAVSNGGWAYAVVPLLDDQLGYYRPALQFLFGSVGILFLIGCLNVASLLLTRAMSREREMAIRTALGATPRQITSQLFAESLVLSVAGTVLGVAIAFAALPVVVALTPVNLPRLAEASISGRVLFLVGGLVAVMTTAFGLVPALLLARRRTAHDLRASERGSSRTANHVYQGLVVAEIGLACALLVCAALLVRTVDSMTNVPLGVRGDNVTIASVQINAASATEEAWMTVASRHTTILDRLREQPGVTSAGATNVLPIDHGWRGPLVRADQPPVRDEQAAPQAQHLSVSDGYLETMGARLLEGRLFTVDDTADTSSVALLNRTAAARYFPHEPAVGRTMRSSMFQVGPLGRNLMWKMVGERQVAQPVVRIVGVIDDVQNVALGLPSEPAIYFPTRQFPFAAMTFAVTARDPATAVLAIREAVRSASPTTPVGTVDTWSEHFRARTVVPTLLMSILLLFGGAAVFLAVIGVYGLLSWSVALRQRELAIRVALGARPIGIAARVLRRSFVLVSAGLGLGWMLVASASAALSMVLFGVGPTDITAAVVGGALLVGAALLASLPPAWRAMRVDPARGLRAE